MRRIGLCGAALMALAGPAAAQDDYGPVDCEETFEGAILGCGEEEEVPSADWLEGPAEEDALADRAEPPAGVGGIVAQAEAPKDEAWVERHPIGEAVDLGEVVVLEETELPDLPPPEPGRRYAEIDGRIVELDAESWELLQLIRRSAGVAEVEAEVREEREHREAAEVEVPPGHLPPPGSCRVWFPDRPPGHQPPPTSCDVRVPEGAVLIRG